MKAGAAGFGTLYPMWRRVRIVLTLLACTVGWALLGVLSTLDSDQPIIGLIVGGLFGLAMGFMFIQGR